MSDLEAEAHAAYAIELASSAALRAMVDVANPEVVAMTWKLGYVQGIRDGLTKARTMIEERQ